ncbi:sigma-70 family RNA polymerase sigma factor, partial [Desulfobacterales bacterium HSG17]|nr:sigma-70 family RNA polymerase sigma factor [Desulfobacterales bacterium HSG17]
KGSNEFDTLQSYFAEAGQYKLLSREKEKELAVRIQENNDKDAVHILITSNLRLVVKIAAKFQKDWKLNNLFDLIQEGNIGLILAVRKFDHSKNVKFSYYAAFWIKSYIFSYIIKNQSMVKIGTTQVQKKLFFNLNKEKQKLVKMGIAPQSNLISENMGIPEQEILNMDQRLNSPDVSLNDFINNDSDTEKIDFFGDGSIAVEDQVFKKEIENLLHKKINVLKKELNKRELDILELRIFTDSPVTLQNLADRHGISRERIRQLERDIIEKAKDIILEDTGNKLNEFTYNIGNYLN